MKSKRVGIAAGGNWIVDRVKLVDCLPGPGMLANVRSETLSTGGAPSNVLADLARLRAPFPLVGVGIVGDDSDGRFIAGKFRALGVDVSNLVVTRDAQTAFTDVMNIEGAGQRVFFHMRGANALFGPEHVNVRALSCRIFHLGYLLLLDRMDERDAEFGTVAARFLAALQSAGILTSVDVVSEQSDRFRTIVPPALKHTDYLILNEIEASRAVGRTVRDEKGNLDGAALIDVVEALFERGRMRLVTVHMPEGVYVRDAAGNRYAAGSLSLPPEFIKGVVGAGDAFCAGMLYGLHEGWDHARAAHLGNCCAAACLSEPGATEGVGTVAEVLELGKRYPEQDAPVTW
jgi:sugar/nucleoside kinase (ribokinase family)